MFLLEHGPYCSMFRKLLKVTLYFRSLLASPGAPLPRRDILDKAANGRVEQPDAAPRLTAGPPASLHTASLYTLVSLTEYLPVSHW